MKTNTPLQNLVSRVADRLSPRNDSSAPAEKSPRPLVIEALEPRILFSGSPAPAPEAAPAESPAAQESAEAAPEESAPASEEASVATPPAASRSGEAASSSEAGSGDTAITLTDTELSALSEAASSIWASSGLTEEQVAALSSASYQISDLGGKILGSAEGNLITIDDDAAGRGWFVDGTPEEDSEFAPGGSATTGIDLLSVLLHEQGHLLGLDDGGAAAGDVMFEVLGLGERHLPNGGDALGAVAGSLHGTHFLTLAPATEDFEDEATGSSVFSDDANPGGPEFTLAVGADQSVGAIFETFKDSSGLGSGGSDGFIDTFDSGNTLEGGEVGTITIETGWSFEVNSIDVAVTDTDGVPVGTETVTFTGTVAGGSTTVTDSFLVDSNTSDFDTIDFTGTNFEGIQLTDLTVSLPAAPSAGFLYLDNFDYTADDGAGSGGGGGGLVGELGILDLAANGGINPNTGVAWEAGDEYRLVFVTSTTRDGTSTLISDYNNFVQTTADAAGLGAATWKVIGSTETVNARDNTSTTGTGGEAIFLTDGATIIATDYGDFWNGHDVGTQDIDLDENGNVRPQSSVFTAVTGGGATVANRWLGASVVNKGTNQIVVETGQVNPNDPNRWARQFNQSVTSSQPFYALSDPLTVMVSGSAPGPIAGVDFEDAAATGWDRAPDDLDPTDGITVSADWDLAISGHLRDDGGANTAGAFEGNFPGRLQSDGSWSITIPDDVVLDLNNITFAVRGATGSTGTPSGRSVAFGTSLDGGTDATPLYSDPNLIGRPDWTEVDVDLSGSLYQGLTDTTVTFFWNGTSAIDIDGIILNGVSSPATVTLDAVDDDYSASNPITEDQILTIAAPGVLANDSGVSGGGGSSGVLLSTDFTGRTATAASDTASTITWTTNGVADPGDLTVVEEDGDAVDELAGFHDTADSQGHLAPNLNTGNEGPWSTTVDLNLTVPQISLESVELDYQHFNNSGNFQAASTYQVNWTATVTGSASGVLGTATAIGSPSNSGSESLVFGSPLALNNSETYEVTILAEGGNGTGNNTGLDNLSLIGTVGAGGSGTITAFDAVSANGAAVTVNPDGSFTYDPTGSATIEALNSGDSLADTFTYTLSSGTVLLDDHFDDGAIGTDVNGVNGGFHLVSNGAGGTGAVTETGTDAALVSTGANNNSGIVSNSALDISGQADGITMTFVITDMSQDPDNNGMFLGLQDSPNEFFRNETNFGLVFSGNEGRTSSAGGFALVTDDIGGGGSAGSGTIFSDDDLELASLLDGFTAKISANVDGWSYEITGVNDTGGSAATFNDSGTWVGSGLTATFYTDFFDNSEYVGAWVQRGGGGADITTQIDRITVTDGTASEDTATVTVGVSGISDAPSIDSNPGDISIFTESTGTDAITNSDFNNDFDTTVRNAPSHTLTGSGDGIELAAGHHLVIYNATFEKGTFGGNENRSEIQSNLNLDGTDLSTGWSQGFIREIAGQNETITAGGGIVNAGSDGEILQLQSFRTDTDENPTTRAADGTGIQLIKLDDSWDYLSLAGHDGSGTDQAIPNSNTNFTAVEYSSADELDSGSFAHDTGANAEDITLGASGHYLIFANTYAEGAPSRTAIIQRLTLGDGATQTEIPGTQSTVYLRGNDINQDTDEGAASIGTIIEATAGQILNVEIIQDVGRNGMTIVGDRTGITIVKLPDDVDYLSLIDTSGDQNLNTATPLNYDDPTSQLEVDFSYTHSTTTNPSQVMVKSEGDYLFLTSAFDMDDSAARGFYNQRWNVNGGTPPTYGQTGQYTRNGGGADQFGNWSGAVFELNGGDYVESTSQPLGAGGTNTADTLAMQGVNLTQLFAPRGAVDDTVAANEDTQLNITNPNAGVLANDEAHGNVLIADTSSEFGATVSMNADGTYTYDPTAVTVIQNLPQGGSVDDTFTYGRGAPEATPGADLYVDAGQDTDGDTRWEDLAAGNPSGFDFELVGGVTRVTEVSALPGISAAYDFPGGATGNNAGALLSVTGAATDRSFQNAPGDWTNEDVSIEIWFKPDNLTPTPTNGQILFEDGGGTGLGMFIVNNELQLRKASGGGIVSANISGVAGEFVQAVATYDVSAGTMELFVNGVSAGTASPGGGDWSGSDPFGLGTRGGNNTGGIGGGQSATESFDGQIAIMRVYRNQNLTASEVQNNYGSVAFETTEVAGLQGYWKLDSIAAEDSSGNGRDGTLTGNLAAGNPAAGQVDNAIDFNATADFVEITGYQGVTGSAARSMAAWVKFEGTDPNQGIMSWGTNNPFEKWTFRTQDSNFQAGAIRIEVNGNAIVGSTDIRDGQWHHVAAVFDPGSVSNGATIQDVRLYVDGQLETGSIVNGNFTTIDTAVANDVRIGQNEGAAGWEGLIDEAAIWDRALSDAEIAEIHSFGQDNGAFENIATVTVTVAGENDAPVANDDQLNVGEDAAGTGNVLTNDTEVDGATPGMTLNFEASTDTDGAIWEDTAGVVADWNFDSLGGTAPALVSVTSGRGQITQAYQFTGGETGGDAAFELHQGTGTVSLQDLPGNASDASATFELWFKPDSLPLPDGGSTNTRQILWEDGGGTGIGLFVEGTELVLKKLPGSGEIRYDISGIADDFIQAAWTFNRGPNPDVLQLYVNGKLVGTDDTANNGNDFSGGDGAAIGGRGEANVGGQGGGDSSSESFQGQVAVFRFYESVLNAAEVQRNYVAIENGFAPVAIAKVETLPSGAIATVAEDGTFTYDPNGAFETLAAGETATETFEYTVVDGDSSEVTVALAEFTTAAQNDNVGDDSPAESGAFAGADLYVRERANQNDPQLEVEAFLRFDLSGASGPVTGATLNLHQFHKLNSVNSANLNIARVLAPWDSAGNDPVHSEGGTPTAVADEFVFGNNGPAAAGPAVDIDHAIDITEWVNGWLADPASNYGVRLRLDTGNVGAAFDSSGPDAPSLVLDVPLASDTGTVTVTITGANDTPVARDNAYTADEDNSVGGSVITDDTGDGVDSDVDASDVPYVESIDTTGTLGQVTITLPKVIGEVGNFATNSLDDSTNPTQTLNNTYAAPVVLATPPTENGGDASVVRITSVTANSFSATLAEAPNHGAGHTPETVDFTVFESGEYTLSDGTKIKVGTVDATGNVFETVSFGGFFTGTPVVMTQIQSFNDTANTFVKTRQNNTSATSFDVKLERAEDDGNHGTETIGYIAIEAGSGTVGGLIYDAATTPQNIDETYDPVAFDRDFGTAPNLVAALASYAGGDPTGLRYRNLDGTGVEFLAEEDTNGDPEEGHVNESVSYFALGGDGDIIGFDAVDYNGTGAFTYDPNGQFDNLNPGETATDTFTYTLGNGPGSNPLLNGLEGFWQFENGTATDRSGNGRDGTLAGDATSGTGQVGGAVVFDGNNDYVDFGDVDLLQGGDFTFSSWFRRDVDNAGTANDTNHNVNNVIIAQSSASANDNFEIGSEGNNLEIYVDTGSGVEDGTVTVAVPGGIANGAWNHVAVSYDSDDLFVFFNGSLITTIPNYNGPLDGSGNSSLSVGLARPDNQLWGDLEGAVDEMAIWSRSLSATEIGEVFAAGQAGDSMIANEGTVTITVTGVNDAPVLVSTNDFDDITVNNTDNAGNTVDDLIGLITDVDDNSLEGIAITGTTVNGTGAVFEFSTDAGGSWSAIGPVSETNALLLRAADLVRFSPDGSAQVDGFIEFKAWDQTGSTTGDEGTKTTTVPDGGSSPFSTEIGVSNVKTVNAAIENGVLVYGETEGRNDLVHIYSDGANVIIRDDAGPISASGDGIQIDPNTVSFQIAEFEDFLFRANDLDDTITVGDMPGFDGSFTIDGEDGFDTVTFARGMTLALGTGTQNGTDENLDVDAETVKIDLDASLSVVGGGTIDITATGGGAEDVVGIQLRRAGLSSEGGAITLVGEGGSSGNHNDGVLLSHGSSITTGGGSVSITGTATGVAGPNDGVSLVGGSDITVGGAGTITLTGTSSGASDGYGVQLFTGTELTADGGDITLVGGGTGTGARNSGIYTNGATVTTTGAGSISLDGAGSGTGSHGKGLRLTASTLNASGGGGITLTGTGGGGTSTNVGVEVGVRTEVTTASGNIVITGTGGAGTGVRNRGAEFQNRSSVISGGDLNITGTAGTGTSSNEGFYAVGATLDAAGTVTIIGAADGSGSRNTGVSATRTTITGGGDVNITGTGSTDASGKLNSGINLNRATVSSSANLFLLGNGGTGNGNNRGIFAINSDLGGATFDIMGTADAATTGRGNAGVSFLNTMLTDTGTIAGAAGGSAGASGNFGVFLQNLASGLSVDDVTGTSANNPDDATGGNYFNVLPALILAAGADKATRKRKEQLSALIAKLGERPTSEGEVEIYREEDGIIGLEPALATVASLKVAGIKVPNASGEDRQILVLTGDVEGALSGVFARLDAAGRLVSTSPLESGLAAGAADLMESPNGSGQSEWSKSPRETTPVAGTSFSEVFGIE